MNPGTGIVCETQRRDEKQPQRKNYRYEESRDSSVHEPSLQRKCCCSSSRLLASETPCNQHPRIEIQPSASAVNASGSAHTNLSKLPRPRSPYTPLFYLQGSPDRADVPRYLRRETSKKRSRGSEKRPVACDPRPWDGHPKAAPRTFASDIFRSLLTGPQYPLRRRLGRPTRIRGTISGRPHRNPEKRTVREAMLTLYPCLAGLAGTITGWLVGRPASLSTRRDV